MPDDVSYRTWEPEFLEPVVRFWNRVFADRRNFFEVTPELFRARVIERETAVERFRPAGFFTAWRGEELVGLLHAGRHPEPVCRVLYPDWKGGETGYVALIVVDPAHRRRGIGSELWHRARGWLQDAAQMTIDGQCINPFYGNSDGPVTPFWGTPEGISVAWEDAETKKFFAQKGFAPRYKAVHLELDVARAPAQDADRLEADLRAKGLEVRRLRDRIAEPGRTLDEAARRPTGVPYESLAALDGEVTAAALTTYPMLELGADRMAIYEAMVHERYRERGIGRSLLLLAIEGMRAAGGARCDVLTLPDVSEAGLQLYSSAGFRPVAAWTIY